MATVFRYWDSAAFLGWLNREDGRANLCAPVIKAAQRGDVRIVTSSLTIAEVLWIRGRAKLPKAMHDEINKFFRHRWILIRELDRTIAERARELVWTNAGVKPQDAVHLATAIAGDVEYDQFDTFDVDLFSLSGKIGDPPLKIGEPNLPPELPFEGPVLDLAVGENVSGQETKGEPV
jgi:predicted nucleic acid-binding protein